MIFTASLGVVAKKAFKANVMQSSLSKIVQFMPLDPETTNMDVVMLGPNDLNGPRQAQIRAAIETAHPDICIIYIYVKDADANKIDCEYKRQVKKIKDSNLQEVFEDVVGAHKIRQGKQRVSSADFVVPESDHIGEVTLDKRKLKYVRPEDLEEAEEEEAPIRFAEDEEEYGEEEPEEVEEEEEPEEGGYEELTFEEPQDLAEEEPDEFEEEPEPMDTVVTPDPFEEELSKLPEPPLPSETIEESLSRINNFEDWEIFKHTLEHDSVVKSLINENTEYVGLINMLDVLDKRIQTVWRDTGLSPDQKFEKIKAIGLESSVVRASTNSTNVEKAISIISTIVLSAKRTVEDKLSGINTALYKVATDKQALMDTSYIDTAIEERTKVTLDLLNVARGIVDIYKSCEDLVTVEIAELDRHLPSRNAFINEMVKPLGTQIFTPVNTAQLANRLMKALQENRVVASQLEDSVNSMIDVLFELCEKDEKVIRMQKNKIDLLQAQRVEDVIVVNTALKHCLRLYTGADDTGRSATAITRCGVLSRCNNALLIDITGRNKFADYGIDSIPLDEFMNKRYEEHFVCVHSDRILTPDEVQDLVENLKGRLNYYPFVNIIVAPEDKSGLDQLSVDAKAIYYITDCSNTSIKVMRDVVTSHKVSNIARYLVTIDAPVSPLMIADSIGIDPTICRVLTLPNLPAIRACALKHDRPYEYEDTAKIFEEVFK